MDREYICMDCLEDFDTEPPYHLEVKHCPYCGSHDICTTEIYNRNEQANADDEQNEEMRLIRRAKNE